MFDNLPEKYKSPVYAALFGFIISIVLPIFFAIFGGDRVAVFGCTFLENVTDTCHSIIPTNQNEAGKSSAHVLVYVGGSLLWYWLEVGRKKSSDDN